MSMKCEAQSKPRVAVWLVLLLGIITVIHMWSHAAIPYKDRLCRAEAAVTADSHPSSQDHHCEQAHAVECVLPAVWSAPPVQVVSILTQAGAAAMSPAQPLLGRSGRAPPDGHRARSVLTHTLEVCRC
ncbi:hypothetical protein OHA77_35715 [Streptosporangium sp. NBC_01639]|uniref:hypothetical protein n=1 Tax=unclassified Streptosporangium TaxID=2632669 RepID=UPI002DDC2302|nr:hypothetical protein [Streptosporangium sp. NBC_01756]WSC87393.1 hypothetical protein OIE48_04030 [Streptosporangium sp. NBC_01756]WTD53924.1 hypothetical protein OHA77_35715 [Streptosporangium sp. NBC_01639]